MILCEPDMDRPSWVAVTGDRIAVASWEDGIVTILDTTDATYVQQFSVAGAPLSLAIDGESVWVGNETSSEPLRQYTLTGELQREVEVGGAVGRILVDGPYLWVGTGSGSVFRIIG